MLLHLFTCQIDIQLVTTEKPGGRTVQIKQFWSVGTFGMCIWGFLVWGDFLWGGGGLFSVLPVMKV